MFSQQYEEELWSIWKNKSVSVLLSMPIVIEVMHKILSESKVLKLSCIIEQFSNYINKLQYSIEDEDNSSENIVNLIFSLSSTKITIGQLLSPLADQDVVRIARCLLDTVKANPEGSWGTKSMSPRKRKTDTNKPCDIFICCAQENEFQYLDGFINPLLLKYNLNAIYPQRDLDTESIGLCEEFIAECKLCFVVITTNYYTDLLVNLFCRRALYYSNRISKKLIVALMDYEPSFVAHSRYMRPIELENAELVIYNENDIEKSCQEFNGLVSKLR